MAPPKARKEADLVPSLRSQTGPSTGDQPFGAASYFSYLLVIYLLAGGLAVYRNYYTPAVVPATGPANQFSEARVLAHVRSITDFGVRIVGTPELEESAVYLLQEGQKLADYAEAHRPDLLVQVFQERYSGAVALPFVHKEYINFYNNITNVILVLTPKAAATSKAVLVNAHFDSALASPGASDDAGCVGIMLELARLLVEDSTRTLASPVVFLMNGAEETLCSASHAFMEQSFWAKNLGVFLNLESTGNQGPDYVFQQTGDWPMQTFVRSAPYPRGSVAAQDVFQLGLIPADTDYRFFSANIQGSLPGLDVASLLGAGAYHTDRDNVDNIRPGTLQAMGENTLAFVIEASKDLALRQQKGSEGLDTQRMVFFDVLGLFMVTYSLKIAQLIHPAPLIVALSLPFLQKDAFPGTGMMKLYRSIFVEALLSFMGMLATLFCSTSIGVFRVTLFGIPMSWHGNQYLAYTFLVPAAAAGSLLPYLGRRIEPRIAALGNIIALGAVSTGITYCGLGMGFIATIWSIAGLLVLSDLRRPPKALLKIATLHAVFPIAIFLPNTFTFSLYILQKANLFGAQGQPDFTPLIADGVAGAVVGLASIAILGILPPWIAYAGGRNGLRRTVLSLFMVSAMFATIVTFRGEQYTFHSPKKVIVQHVHRQAPDGSFFNDTALAVGSVDSVPVQFLLQNQRIYGSKIDDDEEDEDITFRSTEALYVDAIKSGWEWLAIYPFDEEFVDGLLLQDDQKEHTVPAPKLQVIDKKSATPGSVRVTVQLDLPQGHGWLGALNVTGNIKNWSLPSLRKSHSAETMESRFIRICGSGAARDWQFWIEVPEDSALSVRLSAFHTRPNKAIERLVAGWPDWAFPIQLTSFASEYNLL